MFRIFFWAVQPRLYRFWCLLACVFHFFGLSSPDCIGFGVYWPVCLILFWLSSPDCIGFGVYWPVCFIFFWGLSSPDCKGVGVYWPVCFIFLGCPAQIV